VSVDASKTNDPVAVPPSANATLSKSHVTGAASACETVITAPNAAATSPTIDRFIRMDYPPGMSTNFLIKNLLTIIIGPSIANLTTMAVK
jgi:hypothetical protein